MAFLCCCLKTRATEDSSSTPLLPKAKIEAVVVGDTGSGKTSLIFRFSRGRMPKTAEASLTLLERDEMDVFSRGNKIKLVVHDTSGAEEFARVRNLAYNSCDVILICFPVDSPKSLHNVCTEWASEVHCLAKGTPLVLVGTKIDCRDEVKTNVSSDLTKCFISQKQGREAAKSIGAAAYVECSALSEKDAGKSVKKVFGRAMDEVLNAKSTNLCLCCYPSSDP